MITRLLTVISAQPASRTPLEARLRGMSAMSNSGNENESGNQHENDGGNENHAE
ncbi:hypothetical protein ACIOJE_24015 [Kitasatospora sp. NPDC087861]|uniref:hypothetical protein n=1 Tax=Kitasatospora sp. NPDC087861 TaxID=3364070 RepID=UPI00380B417C